jgi:hypothetical protein
MGWEGAERSVGPRDRAINLATSDPARALKEARAIAHPWYRTQALASCARHAPDEEFETIAREALATARRCPDAYQQVASASWPIRALAERGSPRLAREFLRGLLNQARDVAPASSRSEALLHLLDGAYPLGPDIRRSLVLELARLQEEGGHWRLCRNLIWALEMVSWSDPDMAAEFATGIQDDRCRKKAQTRIAKPDRRKHRDGLV